MSRKIFFVITKREEFRGTFIHTVVEVRETDTEHMEEEERKFFDWSEDQEEEFSCIAIAGQPFTQGTQLLQRLQRNQAQPLLTKESVDEAWNTPVKRGPYPWE